LKLCYPFFLGLGCPEPEEAGDNAAPSLAYFAECGRKCVRYHGITGEDIEYLGKYEQGRKFLDSQLHQRTVEQPRIYSQYDVSWVYQPITREQPGLIAQQKRR
jgi:hypothetical protein